MDMNRIIGSVIMESVHFKVLVNNNTDEFDINSKNFIRFQRYNFLDFIIPI